MHSSRSSSRMNTISIIVSGIIMFKMLMRGGGGGGGGEGGGEWVT